MKRLPTAIATFLLAATLLAPSVEASPYCVSGERSVRSLFVAPGETCEFDPHTSSTLRVTEGSILLEGILRMRPASDDVIHRIVFENVREEGFKGGGLGPSGPEDPILVSDPGLWAMRSGQLDIVGTKKTGWTRNPSSAIGWKAKCDLRIAPTKVGDFNSRGWRFGNAIPRANKEEPRAEVFNLTRNVTISGTSEGKSHVFIRSNQPQSIPIRYV